MHSVAWAGLVMLIVGGAWHVAHQHALAPPHTRATPEPDYDGPALDPNESFTFVARREDDFRVDYLDGTSLAGYLCEDVLQLGGVHALVRFGCATSDRTDWKDIDGLLGAGLPGDVSSPLPFPLLHELSTTDGRQTTHDDEDGGGHSHRFWPRVFATVVIMQGDTVRGAELQLGGVDKAALASDVFYTPVVKASETDAVRKKWMVRVSSLTMGDCQVSGAVHALVDSGSSAVIMPPDMLTQFKLCRESVYADLEVTLGGHTVHLPPPLDVQEGTDAHVILGGPFFHHAVVVFDLSAHDDQPRIGVATPRASYTPTTAPTQRADGTHALPLVPRVPRVARSAPVANASLAFNAYNQLAVQLTAGSPRQAPLTVVFDTGSSVTALFVQPIDASYLFEFVGMAIFGFFLTGLSLFVWFQHLRDSGPPPPRRRDTLVVGDAEDGGAGTGGAAGAYVQMGDGAE